MPSLKGFHDNAHLDILGSGWPLGEESELNSRGGDRILPLPIFWLFVQAWAGLFAGSLS